MMVEMRIHILLRLIIILSTLSLMATGWNLLLLFKSISLGQAVPDTSSVVYLRITTRFAIENPLCG